MSWREDAQFEAELLQAEAQMQLLVWIAAGFFVATAVLASVSLIRGHLAHFSRPIVQSKVRSFCHVCAAATAADRTARVVAN